MTDYFSAVPPAPSGASRPGDRHDPKHGAPRDTSSSVAWTVLSTVLATASGYAAWYAMQRVLLDEGQSLAGPVIHGGLAGLASVMIGWMIGRSTSDGGRRRGIAAAIVGGALAVAVIVLATAAVVRDEGVSNSGELASSVIFAGFAAGYVGGWGKRPAAGGRGLAIVGMVLLLGASIGGVALAAEVGPSTPEERLEERLDERREMAACTTEKGNVDVSVRNANYESGYVGWEEHPELGAERQKHPKEPTPYRSDDGEPRFYTWAEADPGWKMVPIGDPPC